MCRCVVASVKYGYFSNVRMQIYRTNYMSLKHLGSNLAVVRLTTLDVKWKLKLLMQEISRIQLDAADFKIAIYQDQH